MGTVISKPQNFNLQKLAVDAHSQAHTHTNDVIIIIFWIEISFR